MTVLPWIAAVSAAGFFVSGRVKIHRGQATSQATSGTSTFRFAALALTLAGWLECLAALGLVAPLLAGAGLWLVPVSALVLAIITAVSLVHHLISRGCSDDLVRLVMMSPAAFGTYLALPHSYPEPGGACPPPAGRSSVPT